MLLGTPEPQTRRTLPGAASWIALIVAAQLLGACASQKNATQPGSWSRQEGEVVVEDGGGEGAVPDNPVVKAQLYDALARMSRAEAAGDAQAAEKALAEAMELVRHLLAKDAAQQDPEARELYRSVITAYEHYYGAADTLNIEYGDIFAFREAMFSSMNDVQEPLDEDVALPAAEVPAPVVPLTKNRLVQQSIDYLLRSPENHLLPWLRRSATYFPMIEQILREEGVPDELKYLALIESGLDPKAISRVGAGGMWQFMPATGRAYGLERTTWVDERLDPEKATRAAARHLRDLYEQFGDWHLVLAAYNAGSGRVSRALRKHGGQATFWDIYNDLPRETRNYVPMYIAATLVASDPSAFGVQSVQPGPRYAYDTAHVEGMLDLRTAADLAATDVATIRALNPEIRQWTTPPSRSGYTLRVPEGSRDRFTQAYAALPPEQKSGQVEYRVRRGDTLGKIARQHGTTVAALQQVNGLRGSLIRVDQLLYVPVRYENYAGTSPGGAQGTQAVTPITLASASSGPAPSDEAALPAPRTSSTRVHYRVRRGDNLTTIAQQYGVSVSDLKDWNNLSGDRIRSGQMLAIFPEETHRTTAAQGAERLVHTVRRGDNLTRIARQYGVSVARLRAWNDLSSDRIRPGQRITVYPGSQPGTATAKRWTAYYVKRGDNLTSIARQAGATVDDVRRWNALTSDRLHVGQRIALYTF